MKNIPSYPLNRSYPTNSSSYGITYSNNNNSITNYNYYNNNYSNYSYSNYNEASIRKEGVLGLKNINGSLCFMNSSLQCLAHIKPLYDKIKEKKKLEPLGFEFYIFITEMNKTPEDKDFEKAYSPENILDEITKIYPLYNGRGQHGANEFISNFLKALHNELNSQANPKKIFNKPKNELLKNKFEKKCEFYNKNRSCIIDLFYGNMLYLTNCKECNNIISSLYSIFNILELSIYQLKKERTISLKELIKSFSNPQEINDTVFCKKCNKNVKAYSKIEIANYPEILIIYINKVIDQQYYGNNINFPSELYLPDDNSQENSNSEKCYDLIGLIEHFGSEKVGHYISICKNYKDMHWYRFNDSIVDKYKIPENNDGTTDSNSVIILFYQRRDK